MGLVRGLGLLAAAAILIGDVIGTGVFLKARVMTCNVGTPGMVIAAWVIGGLLSLAGALAVAELAAMMPRAGGEYVFIREAYGPLPGFLYGWTRFFVASTGAMAGLAAGFAIFVNVVTSGALDTLAISIVPGTRLSVSGLQAVAIGAIAVVTILNCGAITFSGRLAAGFTALKVALVLAVGLGALFLADGSWAHFALSNGAGACYGVPVAARGGAAGFGAAMLGALWAYNGWNEVTYVAEEVREPGRNLPFAIIGGIAVIAGLYIFANLMYFYVLSPTEIANLSASSSVATEVVTRVVGPGAASAMAAMMAMSIFGSLLLSSLVCARIPYAMARDGIFFRALDRVSVRTRVPIRALIAQAAWGIVLVLSGSYDVLTDYAIFSILIFVSLATASVYVFRSRMPAAERPYRTWGYPVTPAIFLLVSVWLVINTVVTTPERALAGLGLMALGLPFYWYWSTRA
ncbi:MAG TPA: amino acid permease [Gemmatimonadaceae bacterium]|nr:amino acid permease [Gemmatimonadaceae bacterium]